MKNTIRIALLATSAMALSSAAFAEEFAEERWPRWYVGFGGGMQFLEDSDVSGLATGNVDFEEGWIGFANIGYRPNFGGNVMDGLRFEIEGAYHDNKNESGLIGGAPVNLSKNTYVLSLMANMIYDVHNGSRFTPYFGGGIGYARVEFGNEPSIGSYNDSDSSWAYQGLAGISFAPESIPLTEWTLGYRYFVVNDPEFSGGGTALELDDLESHNVELGARFRF